MERCWGQGLHGHCIALAVNWTSRRGVGCRDNNTAGRVGGKGFIHALVMHIYLYVTDLEASAELFVKLKVALRPQFLWTQSNTELDKAY